jgi:ketopantoate reductase
MRLACTGWGATTTGWASCQGQGRIEWRKMKTLVLGTGVIGTIYGWALAEAGIDVTHFVRQGQSASYEKGVTLDLLDERQGHKEKNVTEYVPKCVEAISASDNYELIILPTNSYQTEEALRTLLPHAGNALFLVFGANWEGEEFINRLLPKERYLLGYPDAGGARRDGMYRTNLGAEMHLGEVNGKSTPELEQVKALFEKADIQPEVQESMLHWLWLHNAMSIGMWAGFAKHQDINAFLADRPLLVQCHKATLELLELCRRRGAGLRDYPETATFRLPTWLFIIVFRRLWADDENAQRFTAHAVDSLPEAKANYDAMMATASEKGLKMPNMKALGPHLDLALRKAGLWDPWKFRPSTSHSGSDR